MGSYGLTDSEIADLRPFVEQMISLSMLTPAIVTRLDSNRLTKADLSRIQRSIDSVLCGSTLQSIVDITDDEIRLSVQQIAARAHRALLRRRKYDWKSD